MGEKAVRSPCGRVVVIGAINIDISGYALADLVYEDSNLGRVKCAPGGVGRNIAENLVLLGHECHLISVVGNDYYGNMLLEHTRKAGIHVGRCLTLAGEDTSTYLSLMNKNGEMVLAINAMDIIERVSIESLHDCVDFVNSSKVLVLDCNLSKDVLEWLLTSAAQVPVFVDPVSTFKASKIKHVLSYIHTLKPNRLEAETLSGIEIKNHADAVRAADALHAKGVRRIVLSMGIDGVYYSDVQGEKGWSSSINAHVVSVTGAGDAMMAGLVHGWLDNQEFGQSVRFAQACSAMTLESERTNNQNLSCVNVEKLLELRK